MNKTKIEWCDYTWNPVTGCLHGCHYCYARRIAERFKGKAFPNGFEPTYRPERLVEPFQVKKPSRIFAVSMGDLFGHWVPDEWIEQVLEVARQCRHHIFIFLTKNSIRLANFDFPDNAWVGVSFDGYGIEGIPQGCNAKVKFVSIEPLLAEPEYLPVADWYIIGAQTGPGAGKPKTEWVQKILDHARENEIPVFIKDNLCWPEIVQEYPNSGR